MTATFWMCLWTFEYEGKIADLGVLAAAVGLEELFPFPINKCREGSQICRSRGSNLTNDMCKVFLYRLVKLLRYIQQNFGPEVCRKTVVLCQCPVLHVYTK